MAIRRKVTASDYASLSDELKKEYLEKDGEYHVILDGDDEIRRAKDNEVNAHKETKSALSAAKKEIETLKAGMGDTSALDKSWGEKYANREKELIDQLTAVKGSYATTVKSSLINGIATKISNSPSLIANVLEKRIELDLSGDAPKARVLDAHGKPSAMSLEDLEKEIVANKEYSPIIKASNASGGAKTQASQNFGGAVNQTNHNPDAPLRNQSPAQLAAFIKAKKEGV